ncbi:MAG TPA: ComEC family competence protein, partial [Chitinophagaceae bacterium]
MLSENPVPLWKSAPFLRLVLPLIAGIGFQISCPFQHPVLPLIVFFISFIALLFFHHLPVAVKFRLAWVSGACINCLLFATGVLLTWQHTLPNQPGWYGHHFPDSSYALVTIEEPLVEKPKSFKVTAAVEKIIHGNSVEKVTGKVLLYFAKDSAAGTLQYGQQVLVPNRFQRVKNSGNPGGFDYEQYCRFRNIFHHAFLASGDWQLMPTTSASTFRQVLFQRRENFLRLLEKYIPGRQEAALAEALLLGYRDNIDKDLVQAYANTGVVHIIAISGLHLGLIYGLLLWLLTPLRDHQRRWRYIKPILIIAALWLFALLTGAAPSVLRSATMFTAVVAGKFFLHRHTSVYNTLAASAFLLLCYNPYFLMEVGFQLS